MIREHFLGTDPARVSSATSVRAATAISVAERGARFELDAAAVRGCGNDAFLHIESVQHDETR